ncbi:hypothetical protein [Halomonas getboli]|uniref:hypothetical protein n=1 Tax=Halomonas getboli TaxID=2935862 RepID=UPI001FFE43CD|nr:hypothetical protein [Halomonas getboli]MCK2184007.1 hypothetical protein [Halomonas getboli]
MFLRSLRRRARLLIPGCLVLLIGGCLALPQTGLFAFRLAVTTLGVENIRIGPYAIDAGLDTSDLTSLIASGLGAGSLPVQATMALGLGLPAGLPAVRMSGFDWNLDVPGLEAIDGRYEQDVALSPGDDADLRLPLAFDLLKVDRSRLSPLVEVTRQMARTGDLPEGSELSITPGDLSGLGMTLPSGLFTPTIRLAVGENGALRPLGD